jgi:hypothetical protein
LRNRLTGHRGDAHYPCGPAEVMMEPGPTVGLPTSPVCVMRVPADNLRIL